MVSVVSYVSRGQAGVHSDPTQSRYSLQITSTTPLFALVYTGSALQSRTRFLSFPHVCCSNATNYSAPSRLHITPCSAANPTFSANELQCQLEATKAKLLFIHPTALQAGLAAAKAVGLSNDRIALIEPALNVKQPLVTLDEVIQEGLRQSERFVERKLKPGEGKTKIAVSATPLPCLKVIDQSVVVLQLIVWDDGET